MVYSLDENVGRILDTLKREGLEKNTLVVFISDNGGKPDDNGSLNHPLRGVKGQLFEGGIRVPFCLQWPGVIEAGQAFAPPVIGMDLFPTILQLAGGTIHSDWGIDGVDLMPFLTGRQTGRPHETLFWKSGHDLAIRHKDWKLLRQYGKTYLFNLANDSCEKKNLHKENPEMAQDLMKKWTAWNGENVPPNYGWSLKETGIHVDRVPR